jgi:putative MFS transporter
LRPPYRRRLAIVGGAAFLSASFFAPGAEFFTRYLDDVHHFSSYEIVAFLAVTGLPAVTGVLVGGRLADVVGRRAVGVPFLTISTIAYAGFFVASGILLWPLALVANVTGGVGGAALAPYGSELFPTRVRSGANTLVTAIAVVGAALGLGTAGLLASPLGVGHAIAVLAAPALAAVVIVALAFPETARRELEDTAGEAAPPPPGV